MEQLNEKNLRQGTLKYLVDPIVEIDMYSPKIQQDSIVVVMRVEGSYDAGYDMSSFIEKLPFGVLDTEVQEIPNTEGFYEIFIEMERDEEFPANLMRILQDAGSLCAEENSEYVWQGILYAQDNEEPMDIDEKILRSHVRLHPEEQDIREFFEYSLDTVKINETITVGEAVFESCKFVDDIRAEKLLSEAEQIRHRLGKYYEAFSVKGGVLITKDGARSSLYLKGE